MSKLLFFALVLGYVLIGGSAHAGPPHQDKVAHAITAFTVSHLTYVLCKNHLDPQITKGECMAIGIGTSLIVGMAKELVIDNNFDWADEGANILGTGLSIPILIWEY